MPNLWRTEPSQLFISLSERWMVGCVDRSHHVMWCPGCSMPDQAAVGRRSLLLPHTYRMHRTTDDCSKSLAVGASASGGPSSLEAGTDLSLAFFLVVTMATVETQPGASLKSIPRRLPVRVCEI